MEKDIESCLQEISRQDDVTGCVLADKLGLCMAVAGRATPSCAGIVAAIAQKVAKLEPNSPAPVIHLESDTRQCLIQQNGALTMAIFKKSQSP